MDMAQRSRRSTKANSATDKREAILEAALALITRHGVEGFSLRETAREVGIDPAMVYRYFEDRADMVRAVACDGFARLARRMEAAATKVGPSGDAARLRLRALGRAYVEFALARPAQFRAMFGRYDPDVRGVGASGRTPHELLSDALAELDQKGRLRLDARRAALACWATVHGTAVLLIDAALVARRDGSQEDAIEAALETVMLAVSAEAPARRTARRS
jgi:AcrR family transcriptional regulator